MNVNELFFFNLKQSVVFLIVENPYHSIQPHLIILRNPQSLITLFSETHVCQDKGRFLYSFCTKQAIKQRWIYIQHKLLSTLLRGYKD